MGKQRQKDPIKDKKRLIYDALIADDNYKNSLPSSFDSFSKTLENESSAISIYETLSKDDNYKNSLPDQSQWLDTFKKKDYTEVGGGDSQEVSAQQKEPSLESGGYKELGQELGLTGKIEDVSPDKREAIALGAYQQEVVKGVQLQLSNGTITEDEAQISINKKMDDYVNNTHKKEDNLLPEPGIVKGDATDNYASRITQRKATEAELKEGREQVIKNEEERKTYNKVAKEALSKLPEPPKNTFLKKGKVLDKKPNQQYGALGADFGVKLTQEEKNVKYARDILTKISNMSEDEAPGFFSGLGAQGSKMIPFIGAIAEIPKLLLKKDVLNKPQDKRTENEQSFVDAITLLNSFEAAGHKPTSYEYGEMVGLMLPYMGEFALTGGIGTGVAKTVGAGMLKGGIKRGALNYTVRGFAGSVAQATANPQNYIKGTIERMTPLEVGILNLDKGEIDDITRREGEGIGEALGKSYLTNISEMFTERLGFAYGSGAKRFMASKVGKALVNEEMMAKYTLNQFAKRKGIQTISGFKKASNALGFNGVVSEVWGEEVPNMAINELITGDTGKTILESLNPLSEEALNMVIPMMILRGGIYAPTAISQVANKIKSVAKSKFDNVTKEQAIEQVREELDTSNPEAVEANAEALEVKINEELEKEGIVESKPETKPNIEVKEDTTPSADISKTEATKKEESEKKANVGFKVKEETEKVSEELIKEGEQQISKGLEMFSTESKQEDAVKEIGDGLIKQGVATEKNVAQKVKDYLKEQDVEQPNSIIEKVYPSKFLESEKPTEKTKGAKLKKELEKDIEKKDKQGNVVKNKGKYIQRALREERIVPEFRELLKKDEKYTKHDRDLANKRSLKLIIDFQNKFGEKDGLREVAKILKTDIKSEGLPELMMGPTSAELSTRMEALGMREEALDIFSYKEKEGRRGGRLAAGLTADSSPNEVIGSIRSRIATEKLENINKEFKEGKTYNQALKEMQTKIDELESAYKELKETGKIDESFLPEPDIETKTTKSKELKERAKTLRKKGTANLSAYFKSQRGGLSMGLKVDDKLLTALGQILQSYVLEFEGNVLAAYEKFRKDVSDNYEQISQEDIDKVKKDLLSQSEEVINEFKEKRKLQIIEDILKADKKESKEQTDKRKEAAKNILNDINEGKSIEDVSDNLSDLAKFDKIDPKILKEILDISVDYGNTLNEGKLELASDLFDNLMDKLYSLGLKGRAFNEVAMDLWYTAVLSGLTTQRRSLVGSGMTSLVFMGNRLLATPVLAPLMIRTMVKGTKGALKSYLNVLRTGKSSVQIQDVKKGIRPYTNALWDEKFKNPFKQEGTVAKAKAGLRDAWLSFWKPTIFVFRNIVAWDQVIKNATFEANYALYGFENTDKSKTYKQRIKEAEDSLRNDKDEEIWDIVNTEIAERKASGKKVRLGYKFSRFTEIKNTFRDADIIRKAMEDSSEAAMIGTPKGTLGQVYNKITNMAEIKENNSFNIKALKVGFRFVFPFFRIMFNYMNAGLDYTLVGFKRGFSNKRWEGGEMVNLTSFQKREYILKASQGLVATTILMAHIFDWDDWDEDGIKLAPEKERYIIVNGPLTGEWKEDDDTFLGAEPWSIRMRFNLKNDFSSPIKYQDNPWGFIFAPIGIMHDELHYNQFGKTKEEKKRKYSYIMSQISSGTLRYALQKSFNQGISTLFKVFSAMISGDSEKQADEAFKLVSKPVKGFVPGIYKQTYAQYNSAVGTPEKEYINWYENLASKIPLVNHLIKNDRVDVFGYPVIAPFDFPMVPDWILKLATENLDYRKNLKSWKLLLKYDNVVIGRFKAPPKDNYGKRLTEQEKYDYKKIAGLRMREYVEDNYGDLIKKDRIGLQKSFWDYKKWSSEYAKNKISIKK